MSAERFSRDRDPAGPAGGECISQVCGVRVSNGCHSAGARGPNTTQQQTGQTKSRCVSHVFSPLCNRISPRVCLMLADNLDVILSQSGNLRELLFNVKLT